MLSKSATLKNIVLKVFYCYLTPLRSVRRTFVSIAAKVSLLIH